MPEAIIDRLYQMASQSFVDEEEQEYQRDAWRRRLTELERRLAMLVDMRLNGHLTEAEYLARRGEGFREKRRLEEQLDRFELPVSNLKTRLDWFVHDCRELGETVKTGSDDEVRESLQIMGSNYPGLTHLPSPEVDYACLHQRRANERKG